MDRKNLTHLDADGNASMVDVTAKAVTERSASARAVLHMAPATLALVRSGGHKKGDVLAVARIAGIQAAKRTAELIPLCHPINLTGIGVEFAFVGDDRLEIVATCRLADRTGVEMEAMTAASIAALTVYDMCKGVDRGMTIAEVALEHKDGGRSGHWQRGAEPC